MAMGGFCYWVDPCFPGGQDRGVMMMSGIWGFLTLLAGVGYGAFQTIEEKGGKVLLDLTPKPKLTGPQTGKGHISEIKK